MLRDHLARRGWNAKEAIYRRWLEAIWLRPRLAQPDISIVVIAWRVHRHTRANLALLAAQKGSVCELIFVDNGAARGALGFAHDHSEVVVRLRGNTGAYLARNVGALFARAPLLLFLDDDGLAADDLVAAHIDAHRSYDCTTVRGVYLPKTDNPLNRLAMHYHLGDRTFPQYPVIEGNTSFVAEMFFRVGGWDDEIRFGGGGFDISRRILEIDPDMRRLIYHPRPAIRHDYVRDQAHLDAKRAAQVKSFERLVAKHPDLHVFRAVWDKFRGREELLLRRTPVAGREMSAGATAAGAPSPMRAEGLDAALARVGWTDKRGAMAAALLRTSAGRLAAAPAGTAMAAAVIVHTASPHGTGRCLRQLAGQLDEPVQLIAVGAAPPGGEIGALAHTVIEARPGTPVNVLRNLGAAFAEAPVLIFLEDREVPAATLLAAHVGLHRRHRLAAVQGVILPLADSTLNREAGCFFPAERPFPLFADADSNTSYQAEIFYRAGGWSEEIGPEGAGFALARAITAIDPDLRRQIYSPLPVIERDEADDAAGLDERRRRFAASRESLSALVADGQRFLSCWDAFERRDDLLPDRESEAADAGALRAIAAYIEETDYFAAVVRLRRLIDEFPEQVFTAYGLGIWRTLPPPYREEIAARRASPAEATEAEPCPPTRADFAAASVEVDRRLRRPPSCEAPGPADGRLPPSIFCLKTYRRR
jgi:Glycosyl transferase family 2